MSEPQSAALNAIDDILYKNPDMPEEFRTKIETLRERSQERVRQRSEFLASSLEKQEQGNLSWEIDRAAMRERSERGRQEFKAFSESWLSQTQAQTALIRRIADKL